MEVYNGLCALLFITFLQGHCAKITFPIESSDNETKFVRSMEVGESSEREIYLSDSSASRKFTEDDSWNELDYQDRRKGWSPPPDEKTISVQMLDNEPYYHGRPAWPHDEYILGYFDLRGTPSSERNGTNDSESLDSTSSPEDLRKYYEWKRLQQPESRPSNAFIGPGFYDVGSNSNLYDPVSSSPTSPEYYRYYPSHQAVNTGITTKIQTGSQANTETVPGTASESITNTRQLSPYLHDLYKRKRLRLQIHPGLIAAPLAGLAAFGAASALTSKPLLVELGYVRNKPNLIGGGGGGWGWAGSLGNGGYRPYPPFYPPPNPPPLIPPVGTAAIAPVGLPHHHPHHHHGHGTAGPLYPILKPNRIGSESEKSSWWNPFSALTPRLIIER